MCQTWLLNVQSLDYITCPCNSLQKGHDCTLAHVSDSIRVGLIGGGEPGNTIDRGLLPEEPVQFFLAATLPRLRDHGFPRLATIQIFLFFYEMH